MRPRAYRGDDLFVCLYRPLIYDVHYPFQSSHNAHRNNSFIIILAAYTFLTSASVRITAHVFYTFILLLLIYNNMCLSLKIDVRVSAGAGARAHVDRIVFAGRRTTVNDTVDAENTQNNNIQITIIIYFWN